MTYQTRSTTGIGTPIRLRNGKCHGLSGTYWAWPVDGYFDLHHTAPGLSPDGSDVVSEGHVSLSDARATAREWAALEKWADTA